MEDIIRPFIPYDAFTWLDEWIKPDMSVFEYGSGMSTLWFAKKVKEVVSVENDPTWSLNISGKIHEHLLTNISYVFEPEGDRYSKLIHNCNNKIFDLVFVDGRFRKECMEECYNKAKYAIFLDNSDADHYQDAYEIMKSYKGGSLIDFKSKGLNPYTGEDLPMEWQASVFIKEV